MDVVFPEMSSLKIPGEKFYTAVELQIKEAPPKSDYRKLVVLVTCFLYVVIFPFFFVVDIGLDVYAGRLQRTNHVTMMESRGLPRENLGGKVTTDGSSEYGIIQDAVSGSSLSSSEYEDVTWGPLSISLFLGSVKDLEPTKKAIECLRTQHPILEQRTTFSFVFSLDDEDEPHTFLFGPLSISLFLGSVKDLEPTKKAIECLRTQHPILEQRTTFSFVFSLDDEDEPMWRFWNGSCDSISEILDARNASLARTKVLYPINLMRNVARNSSRTHYFAVCDMDITPNPGLRDGFKKMARNNKMMETEDAIYIMPVFELENGTPKPKNKMELRLLYEEGIARQFFFTWSPLAQGQTDYANWFALPPTDGVKIAYEVEWRFLYEPLFIAPNTAPRYFEKIKGYSYEQGTHACELSVSGWKFYVLDNAFITHDGFKLFRQSPFVDRMVRQRLSNSVISQRIYKAQLLSRYGRKARQCSSFWYRATEVTLMTVVQFY
ncbi:unnamed protein product [Darwinula stevensoni]|uniref:Beta-1,4-glucuronyltransferase 1 n=1 Tax=Darwinula stevensoni TaxID=69355 RepID=A0A7R9AB10_9CRUS|nr:unnamed protein product [Darwinula stevensoni]CAG0898951.1 unnamed protein product [Darwinula stevensoni]